MAVASIERRESTAGIRYSVRWRDPDGTQRPGRGERERSRLLGGDRTELVPDESLRSGRGDHEEGRGTRRGPPEDARRSAQRPSSASK